MKNWILAFGLGLIGVVAGTFGARYLFVQDVVWAAPLVGGVIGSLIVFVWKAKEKHCG